MKRIFRLPIVLCLLFLLAMLTTACGKQNQPVYTADSQPLKLTFGGGAPSGTWYLITNGVSECVNKSYPGSNVTVIPGSSVPNIVRVNSGQIDLSMSTNFYNVSAAAGGDPFNEKLDNLAAVASLYPSYFQLVVDKKLGVTSMDEIIARKMKIRISVESVASNTEVAFKQMLNEYGITEDDINAWGGDIVNKNKPESVDMLTDGLLDGFANVSLYPVPNIQEAAVNNDLVLLSINPAVIDSLCQKYGYSKGVIPANTYSFNDIDVATFNTDTVIIIPKDAPDEVGYKVARSIHQNLEYLRTVHVALKDLKSVELTQNLGAPLHKGAEKYYREAGIIK